MQAILTPMPAAMPNRGQPSAPDAVREHAPVDSATMLQGHKAVTIVHNGAPYRLQATRLGKLILTK